MKKGKDSFRVNTKDAFAFFSTNIALIALVSAAADCCPPKWEKGV